MILPLAFSLLNVVRQRVSKLKQNTFLVEKEAFVFIKITQKMKLKNASPALSM